MALKNAKALVVDLVNADNQTTYTVDMLDFSPVEILDPEHESLRDVRVTLTPLPGSGRKGERVIYYNLLALDQVFNNETPSVDGAGAASIADFVTIINETYDTEFGLDDITIPEFTDGVPDPLPDTVTVVALAGSYAFKGQMELELYIGLIDLADEIQITVLNGLQYPEGDISGIGDITVVANQTLPTDLTDEDGNLIVGTGNPGEGFLVATNGEVLLGITARLVNDPTIYPTVNGIITLMLPSEPIVDWNIPFVVALMGEAIGQCVTDLYDVDLVLRSAEGEEVAFTLVEDDTVPNKVNWVSEQAVAPILDNAQTVDGDNVQNIQRLSMYDSEFPTSSKNTNGIITGMCRLTLSAGRKDAVTQRVVATIHVNVVPTE